LDFGGGEVEEAVDVLVEFGFQADGGLGSLLVLSAALFKSGSYWLIYKRCLTNSTSPCHSDESSRRNLSTGRAERFLAPKTPLGMTIAANL
jgi:hypothetical protein